MNIVRDITFNENNMKGILYIYIDVCFSDCTRKQKMKTRTKTTSNKKNDSKQVVHTLNDNFYAYKCESEKKECESEKKECEHAIAVDLLQFLTSDNYLYNDGCSHLFCTEENEALF